MPFGDEEVWLVKRRGRPPKSPEQGIKAGTINFRVHDAVRARIAEAAAMAGRSVTEEVEYRVAKSVRTEEEAFGGPETYALMLGMAQRLKTYERRFGKPWIEIDDPRFHRAAGQAFAEQIALCQADLDLRPLTREEADKISSEPRMDLSGLDDAMPQGDWLPDDDHDLPPDPESPDQPPARSGKSRSKGKP